MAVGQAPGEDGFDGLALKGDGEVVAVDIGDDAVAHGDVSFLHGVVVHVEFGEVDLEAQGLRAVDELAQALAEGCAEPAEMWDWMPRASRGTSAALRRLSRARVAARLAALLSLSFSMPYSL